MRKLAALLTASYFLLSLSIASATIISIGVQPSEITVDAAKNVSMRFWNTPAEADAIFNVSVKDDLKPYVVCDWCGKEFVVNNYTSRLGNPVIKTIGFAKPAMDFNSSIFVYARPVGANATAPVLIQPRVEVRVILFKTKQTTTTTTTTTTTVIISPTTTAPGTSPTTTTASPTTTAPGTPTTTTTTITTIPEGWFEKTWNYYFPKTNTTSNTTSNITTTTTASKPNGNSPDWVVLGGCLVAMVALAGFYIRFYL